MEQAPNNVRFKTFKTSIRRIKVESVHQGTDEVIHYVHATDIKRCYLFAILYALVMQPSLEPSGDMFPTWKSQVKFTKKGTESQVSQKFAKYMQVMINIAKNYIKSFNNCEDLPINEDNATKDLLQLFVDESEGKTLYMGKKFGIQILGDSNLAPQVCLHLTIICSNCLPIYCMFCPIDMNV